MRVGVARDTPVRARERATPPSAALRNEVHHPQKECFYCGKSAVHNSGCGSSPYLGIFMGSYDLKEFKEF